MFCHGQRSRIKRNEYFKRTSCVLKYIKKNVKKLPVDFIVFHTNQPVFKK